LKNLTEEEHSTEKSKQLHNWATKILEWYATSGNFTKEFSAKIEPHLDDTLQLRAMERLQRNNSPAGEDEAKDCNRFFKIFHQRSPVPQLTQEDKAKIEEGSYLF